MRWPRAEDGWLFVGYAVWVGLIWVIWQVVARLVLGPPG